VGDLAEHMTGHQHRPPFGSQVAQQFTEPADAFGVEPVGRLVEDQDLRIGQQGGGETEPLAHAERELSDAPISRRGQIDEIEHLIDSRLVDFTEQRLDAEMVSGTSPRVGVGGIEDRSDDVQRMVQLLVGATVDSGTALGRGGKTQQDAQGRRLPGPVGPEEADHLTRVDLEAQIIDGDKVAEAFGEIVQLDYRHGGRPS
jgi:hypothetical protein